MRCAVFGCNSNNNSKKYINKTMNFFRFPKDPDICETWINACSRADKFNVTTARICHLHFSKEKDFVRCLREELLGEINKSRRQLKEGVVPTLMLNNYVHGQKAKTIYALVKSSDHVSGQGDIRIEERILLENENDLSLSTKKTQIKTKKPAKKPVIIRNLKNITLLGKQLKVQGGTRSFGNNNREKTINILQKSQITNRSSGIKIEKSSNKPVIIINRENTGSLGNPLQVEGDRSSAGNNDNNSEKTVDDESTNRNSGVKIEKSENKPVIIINIKNTALLGNNFKVKSDKFSAGNINSGKALDDESILQRSLATNTSNGIKREDPTNNTEIITNLLGNHLKVDCIRSCASSNIITNSSAEINAQGPSKNYVIEGLVETLSNATKGSSCSGNISIEKAVNVENVSQRLIITSRSIGTNTEGSSDSKKIIAELEQKIAVLEWQSKGLKNIFSPAQIKRINEPLKRPRWSEEDISDSIVLFANGPKVYKLLLEKGYPLPAINTLRLWMKNANIKNLYLKTKMHSGTKRDKTISNKIKKTKK